MRNSRKSDFSAAARFRYRGGGAIYKIDVVFLVLLLDVVRSIVISLDNAKNEADEKVIDDYWFIVGAMAAIIGLAQGKWPGVVSNMTVKEWDFSCKAYATTSTDSGELWVV